VIFANNRGRKETIRRRCALSIGFARSSRARTDKSRSRKSPRTAVYEPAARTSVRCGFTNTRINSGFIIPADGSDRPIVPAAKCVCARDAYTRSSIKYSRCISL